VEFGEGALPVRHSLMYPIDFSPAPATSDPRAPRKRATTQRCIFVGDYNTPSASVTTDREDAIPPGRWACTRSENEAAHEGANPVVWGCNSDRAHHSITPRGQIRGRPVRRSQSSMLPTAECRPRKRGALHNQDVGEVGRTTTRTRTKCQRPALAKATARSRDRTNRP
jgi:hypothetical protein